MHTQGKTTRKETPQKKKKNERLREQAKQVAPNKKAGKGLEKRGAEGREVVDLAFVVPFV